jgi:hypothetical protein
MGILKRKEVREIEGKYDFWKKNDSAVSQFLS